MRRALLLGMAVVVAGCGGGGDPVAPPVPVLTTVTVTLLPATLSAGQSTTATVAGVDQFGAAIATGVVTWATSAPAVATVNASGAVSAVGPGSAVISATSGTRSGQATLTVTPAAISTVTLAGPGRLKVGDDYAFSVTARLADGTVANRPVTFSIADPSAGTITAEGVLRPLRAGVVRLVATIDGTPWNADLLAYDWMPLVTETATSVGLEADSTVRSFTGQNVRPLMLLTCGAPTATTPTGFFALAVGISPMITHDGAVTLQLDGNPPVTMEWIEVPPSYTLYIFPSTNSSITKSFATQVATARKLRFTFREYEHELHTATFRLTGMAAAIAPALASCANAQVSADGQAGTVTDRSTATSAVVDVLDALQLETTSSLLFRPLGDSSAPRGGEVPMRRGR